jgi:hypothetical protein
LAFRAIHHVADGLYFPSLTGLASLASVLPIQGVSSGFLTKTQRGEINMFTGRIQTVETNKRQNSVRRLLSFLVLSVFALTIFAGKARAQIIGDLDVNIPFQFHA